MVCPDFAVLGSQVCDVPYIPPLPHTSHTEWGEMKQTPPPPQQCLKRLLQMKSAHSLGWLKGRTHWPTGRLSHPDIVWRAVGTPQMDDCVGCHRKAFTSGTIFSDAESKPPEEEEAIQSASQSGVSRTDACWVFSLLTGWADLHSVVPEARLQRACHGQCEGSTHSRLPMDTSWILCKNHSL